MTADSIGRRPRGVRWRRAFAAVRRRGQYMPAIEAGVVLLVIGMAVATWLLLSGSRGEGPLTPFLVAALLIANLVPAIGLLILLGRRVARARALSSPIGGSGRLHVRLVAIFSALASVPMLLVVVFASLLFQYGVEFWYSDRARGMIENAREVGRLFFESEQADVADETRAMVGDIQYYLTFTTLNAPDFAEAYAVVQVQGRKMYESAIIRIDGTAPQTLAIVNPNARPVEQRLTGDVLRRLAGGEEIVIRQSPGRIDAVTRLLPDQPVYLYNSRVYDPLIVGRSETIIEDYDALLERSRRLQLRFNAALYVMTLLIVGAAVLIALQVADRLVRPVGDLVGAARRVASGDLTARVESRRARDEVGTLAAAFNRMTRQLDSQRSELVAANDQLDSRRAFTEAVLSGVSAGVVSVDADRRILLVNRSAGTLLRADGDPAGRPLVEIAPELDAWLEAGGEQDAVVQLGGGGGEPRTVAIRRVEEEGGIVLTFDDITQQLADQRRAAWSDVARRIAHEIKNPLTPIQLAAERLQRRYGKEVASDPGTFARLTETIVRQVGDLRRMVDEFSSFARMPKPVFRPEPIADLVRQSVFLHQVAHPGISFDVMTPEPPPTLVCDRRQIAQAMTNLVKNGVEAIEARRERDGGEGRLSVTIARPADDRLEIVVEDDGVGLPADRERLVEPYVTTRARGTGLGLAIVKKIAEEHLGTLSFGDRPGGGTRVTLAFDPHQLDRLDAGEAPAAQQEDRVTDHAA